MIHKAYLAKRDKKTFEIWGSGKPLRQNIYSLDLARLLIWMIRKYASIEPLALTTDPKDEKSIDQWSQMVLNAFDFDGEVVHLPDKADGQYRKTADNSKLRRLYPEFEFTPLEKAIKETVDWFSENYETARK